MNQNIQTGDIVEGKLPSTFGKQAGKTFLGTAGAIKNGFIEITTWTSVEFTLPITAVTKL